MILNICYFTCHGRAGKVRAKWSVSVQRELFRRLLDESLKCHGRGAAVSDMWHLKYAVSDMCTALTVYQTSLFTRQQTQKQVNAHF